MGSLVRVQLSPHKTDPPLAGGFVLCYAPLGPESMIAGDVNTSIGGKPSTTASGGNFVGGFLNRKEVISAVRSHDH